MRDGSRSGRRRRHTPTQRAHLVARFRRGGLSRAAFARREGLALSTLCRWLAEASHQRKGSFPVAFRELRLAPGSILPDVAGWAMEIVSPEGVTVRCREPLAVEVLSRLLRRASC